VARMNKAEQAACREWAELHRCCAICWWPESDGRRYLHVHHICGGAARKHDVRNYCRLCDRCHEVLHSGRVAGNYPDLDNSAVLWAKQESDPDNYDPAFLASLRHRKWLGYDPAPPDQWYLDERQHNLTKARKP
jgi:hypothetical protein